MSSRQFRAYAPLLVSQALRHKEVTYTNVSAAPHTWPIIEAQGFSRYSDGIFVCLPALQRAPGGDKVTVFAADASLPIAVDAFERKILLQHAEHGCISLWVVSGARAFPFVFRPRLVKGFIPLRATDLLPRHGRFHAVCRADRALSDAARPRRRHR